MKVTRTATSLVTNPPKGAEVTFQLNEAFPELQKDRALLATIRRESTHGPSDVLSRDDPPFRGCLVTWRQRRNGTESIIMFSAQAAAIITTDKPEGLARTNTGHYDCILGRIDRRHPFVGLISKDQKRALLIVSSPRTLRDLLSVLVHCGLVKPTIYHQLNDRRQPIPDRIRESAELLIARANTTTQAFEAAAKYAIPYLEDMP
jgi:hypothetical protein